MSSSRCNCRARLRWRGPPRSFARSRGSRWTRPASSRRGICRLSGATRTQASNAAALFPVFDEPEARLKKGLTRTGDHRRTAQAAVGDRGRFHHRHPAAADAGHRHRRRLHHAYPGPAGPRAPSCWRPRPTSSSPRRASRPASTSVFSPFSANTPQLFVDIDRVKAQKLGVPMPDITDTIQTYFGSTYVNDFNLFGRTYHVTAQADLPFRKETHRSARLRTRNANGDMVMLGSVVDFKDISGPDRSRATISTRPPSCRAKRRRA